MLTARELHEHRPNDMGWGRGQRPVINVSWDVVSKEYLPWLSRKAARPTVS